MNTKCGSLMLISCLLLVLTACGVIKPRDLVGQSPDQEELALVWFPQGNVWLWAVDGEKLDINLTFGSLGDRIYVHPGQRELAVVIPGMTEYINTVKVQHADQYIPLPALLEANTTYVLSSKGPECAAPACLHRVGEGVNPPSQPWFYDSEYSAILSEGVKGEIVSSPAYSDN